MKRRESIVDVLASMRAAAPTGYAGTKDGPTWAALVDAAAEIDPALPAVLEQAEADDDGASLSLAWDRPWHASVAGANRDALQAAAEALGFGRLWLIPGDWAFSVRHAGRRCVLAMGDASRCARCGLTADHIRRHRNDRTPDGDWYGNRALYRVGDVGPVGCLSAPMAGGCLAEMLGAADDDDDDDDGMADLLRGLND